MRWMPCVVLWNSPAGVVVRVGDPLVDEYLVFMGSRARPNTVLAAAFDLKVFFTVVGKAPLQVRGSDVLGFIRAQQTGAGNVVRLDGSSGLASSSIRRRLSSVSGFYAYVNVRDDTPLRSNPVPKGLLVRREGRPKHAPLVRSVKKLPRVLAPSEIDGLVGALRTERDRAMVDAMVLGGLRRCEVLGLRLADVRLGERRVFIAEGKGGRQRLIPMSSRFFATLGRYLDIERPKGLVTDRVFVALKGQRRGLPLSPYGLDQIIESARGRAGLAHASCHELRHTCFTRLREAGMSLEALQAQAGRVDRNDPGVSASCR